MQMPNSDAKWIIGIMLAALAALSVQINRENDAIRTEMTAHVDGLRTEMTAHVDGLRAEMTAQIGGVRAEVAAHVDGLRAEVAGLRADVRRFDDRLRAVEIETGKVVQRLAILERIMLPTPDPGADE